MSNTHQVLEFSLGDNRYGVAITDVDEIVEKGSLTPLPKSEDHVEGVMDLRGETTTIVDPKRVFDVEGETAGDRIIIFDEEKGQSIGWIVDRVHEVSTLDEEEVESVNEDAASIRGVIQREDRFVIWVDPDPINSLSTDQSAAATPA